jgi:hypothetical protein
MVDIFVQFHCTSAGMKSVQVTGGHKLRYMPIGRDYFNIHKGRILELEEHI